jgi:hypothetical protein
LTFSDGATVTLSLGAAGAHSTLARTGGTWAFDATSQAFTFDDLGAATGSYAGIFTGLAGTETGLSDIANWSITNSGWTGVFSYNGGTNSVDFNLTAIPEPSAVLLVAFGLASMVALRRRSSKYSNCNK